MVPGTGGPVPAGRPCPFVALVLVPSCAVMATFALKAGKIPSVPVPKPAGKGVQRL